jgi:alpha-amylase
MSNSEGGSKKMEMGAEFSGMEFYDALGNCSDVVVIDEDGFGVFPVGEKSVSVWSDKSVLEDLTVNY